MATIKSVSPIGFNIKTTTGVIFAGERLPAPLPENILIDLKEKPYRWAVEYEEAVVTKPEVTKETPVTKKKAVLKPKKK
jgi:hypothetical protein